MPLRSRRRRQRNRSSLDCIFSLLDVEGDVVGSCAKCGTSLTFHIVNGRAHLQTDNGKQEERQKPHERSCGNSRQHAITLAGFSEFGQPLASRRSIRLAHAPPTAGLGWHRERSNAGF